MTAPKPDGLRGDLMRRLHRTRADVEHIETLIARHKDYGDDRSQQRLESLERDLRNAQIDCGRLEGELAELDTEPVE